MKKRKRTEIDLITQFDKQFKLNGSHNLVLIAFFKLANIKRNR